MARRPKAKRDPKAQRDEDTPWLEYAASGLGIAFAASVLGIILWHGLTGEDTPPDIALETVSVHRGSGGYSATVRVLNRGSRTASEVRIEGEVDGQTGTAVFDFVPGGAEREGTLVFRTDPGPGGVALRVLGYREP